jgi:phenylacetate-CoA ligase
MWKYRELAQYQFIQLSEKKYQFKLSSPNKFDREKELVEEFRGYLGSDAEIKVTYVEEIPLLASGKRKKVVNMLTANKGATKKVAQ